MGRKRTAVSIVEAQPAFVAPAKRTGARTPVRRFIQADKRPDGSPLPYVVTEAGLAHVRELSADGCTVATIAEALGISQHAFADIRKRQPECQDALDHGRGAMATELTDILMTHARNGNIIAAIHLSKSRAGFVEGDGQVEGASPKTVNNTQINITIPAPMSADDVAKVIGALPPPTEPSEGGPYR